MLDMFAGGGAIPLEALRLGCEAYALDLNPVAHIIQLCTLVYPQKYGKPDPNARGMSGPKGKDGKPTWGGLADEVRYWGEWVLKKVKAEIGDLYPPVPDMEFWSGTGCQPVTQEMPLFPGVKNGVAKTRRHLPHWEREDGCYFLTWRTAPGIDLPPETRSVVLDNLKHWSGQRYDLWQAVVMPDHVHALLSPLPKEGGSFWSLSEIMHTAKSYTANQINKLMGRSGVLWQDERFDHLVRNPASFEEKWHYIRQNPCKEDLVLSPAEYEWLYENDGLAARPTLTPVAYLWTRTVKCKNPACGATVPLVKQTWLCKKKDRYMALKMVPDKNGKRVQFRVVKARSSKQLGFDPSAGSRGGNSTCLLCGTVSNSDYVKAESCAGRLGKQMMAIVCVRSTERGKVYLSADDFKAFIPDDESIGQRLKDISLRTGINVPDEPIESNPRSMDTHHFGIKTWGELYSPRQGLCLVGFSAATRDVFDEMVRLGYESEAATAVTTFVGVLVDKLADYNSSLCAWHSNNQQIMHTFGRQSLPMVWDYTEVNPFGGSSGSWQSMTSSTTATIPVCADVGTRPAVVRRGSATELPWPKNSLDAVITDPPYYDNISYSNLSDYFFVWLKRTIGNLYSEHFASSATPKKKEAIAAFYRHGGDRRASRDFYEISMQNAFGEAHGVLKPTGQMVVVYAHKTTLGWSTLVNALRQAQFTVTEAWPLDTEMKSRLIAKDTAAHATSIFLAAVKRDRESVVGSYESEVRKELQQIVGERVKALWAQGITGADLVISCVGAGLRAFTRFAQVEYANGEEVPAERFLAEVETVVLETILNRLSREVGGNGSRKTSLAGVDPATRFYILWRYTYRWTEIDAGEAIIFANGTHVELEGQGSLSYGSRALIEKKKSKYRLRDFEDRGEDEKLGLSEDGAPVPLIDSLHRALWLMEHRPRKLAVFLRESRVNREQMRLVAQALAGPALKGGEVDDVSPTGELASLAKITANWKSVVEDTALTLLEREALRTGQQTLQFEEEPNP